MTMKDWAENEVKLLCEKFDNEYDKMCALSALDAYNYILNQDHSGCSFEITKSILFNLMGGKPLTPIEDTPEIWEFVFKAVDGSKIYQCIRRSSLFKNEYLNGTVTYNDNNMFYCKDVNTGTTYGNNFVEKYAQSELAKNGVSDAMITFPYNPIKKPIRILVEDFKYDLDKDGDFDTIGVSYAILPNGEKVDITGFFAEDRFGEWTKITFEEYFKRRRVMRERVNKDEN